jgi:hypothetical protein
LSIGWTEPLAGVPPDGGIDEVVIGWTEPLSGVPPDGGTDEVVIG